MDAYSITFHSASKQHLSRIYQDLQACRRAGLKDLGKRHSLGACPLTSTPQNPGRTPHIGVIGAGMAGLRCADILLQYGCRVTILEGRNRVGGRVGQTRLHDGHLVDLGPNWIHGEKDNPILDIAKDTETDCGTWDTNSYMFDEQGSLLSIEESEKYSTIMWDIVGEAFKFSNQNCDSIDPHQSLWDFFQAEVPKRIPGTEEKAERSRGIVLQVAHLWGSIVGSPIQKQSLKYFWLEENIEGDNMFCPGTFKKILDAVSKPALEEADVKFERTITGITCRPDRAEKVKVRTKVGETFEFDDVVLTAPLGWLKRNLGAFEPPLPARLTQAINKMGYGTLEKVYISFPKAFWLAADEDERKIQGFCQWLAPTYHAVNTGRWNQEVVELASLSEENSHPTLLFYCYGDQSALLTGETAKLDSQAKKDGFVLEFFKPYYSRLPHYSETSPDCQPLGCVATNWSQDELAGCGSYTNFPVGLDDADADIKAMRQGVPEGGLWLAGEHTAPFVGLGTAHGAYWSGQAVARRIAEEHGLVRKKADN